MMLMKILNIVFGLALLLAGAVQYNDPDALYWIAVYALSGIACLAAAFGLGIRPLSLAMLVICVAWGLYLLPAVPQWLANHPIGYIFDATSTKVDYMEGSRESLGLLLAAVMLVVSLIFKTKRAS
jgi:hypothetical protein